MLDEDVELAEPELDDVEEEIARREVTKRRIKDATRVVTFAVFVMVFGAAVIGNWLRSQNVDPMYAYDVVLRTMRFGGTYYQNGINDWGPSEMVLYNFAARITSHDGFWYVISFLIAIAALILAFAAARTAIAFGANRDLAVAAGVVVFIHFTFSPSDYAGVLYVRNITTALLAVVWMVTLYERAWISRRRALASAIVGGALLGLAVQTLLTTAVVATVLSLALLALARGRRPREEILRIDLAFFFSGVAAFLSAPVWYLLRGSFTEFFSGMFTYGTYMSSGTGRSLGSQFALGWDQFYAYYEKRPLAFVVILAFVVMVALDWAQATRRDRILYAGLIGWFAASWIELILSQRYSSHYFAVSTLPTALMAAALAGRGFQAITERRGQTPTTFAWPLLALVLALYLFGPANFVNSMRDLSNFTSVKAHAAQVASGESGEKREARAVLDLVSKEWDPLLVWTNDPWPYLDYHRVSATRFIWKSFLLGEIYLGRTSPKYILPHSWQWWQDDLDQAKPLAYLNSNGGELPAGTPFDNTVKNDFTVVYPATPIPISYRNDVAAEMLRPNVPDVWTARSNPDRSDTGWKFGPGTASFRDHSNQETDRLPISPNSCFALSGTVKSDGAPGGIVFWFNDNAKKQESVNLDFDGDHVSSASEATEYHRMPSDVTTPGSTPTPFTLIVGRRAAALVVSGQIRAAVSLPKSVNVQLRSQRGVLDVNDLRTGTLPAYTGC